MAHDRDRRYKRRGLMAPVKAPEPVAARRDITHRDELGDALNARGLVGVGAEIGCAFGAYARTVLSRWRGQCYLLVDLWADQPHDVYREDTSAVDFSSRLRECEKLAAADPRVQLVRADSVQAARGVQDGSLDFVYIDANHARPAVLADMDAWWPKLRSGGIFAGHDYYDDTAWPHFCEVKTAVNEWMAARAVAFTTTPCSSWWAIRT